MTPRTPRPRPRTRARAGLAPVALAVAAVVGLGACSAAGDPGTAAVVDGRVVAEEDVQTVVQELPLEVTQGARVDPVQVLSLLVAQDAVEAVAREYSEDGPATLYVSEQEAEEFLAAIDAEAGRQPQEYSDATLTAIATNLMFANIQQTDVAAPALQQSLADLDQADITLNPRYGQVGEDGELLFGDYSREWLAPADGTGGVSEG